MTKIVGAMDDTSLRPALNCRRGLRDAGGRVREAMNDMNTEAQAIADSHSLKRGSLTWVKVAALGVAISVSGCFAGWNYGLATGGAGGACSSRCSPRDFSSSA